MEDQSKLEIILEGKILLKETDAEGNVEENELPHNACEALMNQLIHVAIGAAEDLIAAEQPVKQEDEP